MIDAFDEIKGRLGFGFMRLPMKDGEFLIEESCKLVDEYMARGYNYFDTAHNYWDGRSEKAIKECVVDRYPRESFLLADKMTGKFFETREELIQVFNDELAACGVDYFDFYLLHSQTRNNYYKYKECQAYETILQFKEQGKIRHVGFSFHDSPELLEEILNDYPMMEFVQLQFNYLDYEHAGVQSKACYDVCVKHNKPVFVMEPVKGGSLENLSPEAAAVFEQFHNGSNSSYAIRFVAGHDQIRLILSGMCDMDQVKENTDILTDFVPLNDEEMKAVWKVRDILLKEDLIPCTACRYCTSDCPKHILIPDLFADLNTFRKYRDWNSGYYYKTHVKDNGLASDCIKCGQCERVCPQHLPIRELLKEVVQTFETEADKVEEIPPWSRHIR